MLEEDELRDAILLVFANKQDAKGARQELADKELAEIAIIESYLPQQMSEAEMQAAVAKAVAETGATTASHSQ